MELGVMVNSVVSHGDRLELWICQLVAILLFPQLWNEVGNSVYLMGYYGIKCVDACKVFRTVANTWYMLSKYKPRINK